MSVTKEFYFKEGKLELSMLDDDSYENETEEMKDILDEDDLLEPKLVVSSDVYKTLHYMGKYLTIKEEVPKAKNQYESLITKEDEISHSKNKNVKLQTNVTPSDEVKSANSEINAVLNNDIQNVGTQNIDMKEVISWKENSENECVSYGMDEMKSLSQQSIDSILEARFKNSRVKPYRYAEELKKHIDKQIESIRNYN